MKNNLDNIFLIVLLTFQTVSCGKAPQKEMVAVKEALDLAIKEKLNVSNPVDFYFLQDSVYKVLEEIEKKKSNVFPAKYDKETEQLKNLIIQLERLRINKKDVKEIIINDTNIEVDSL